jgi:ElaB/YqjD/DUF883 family membrane-anchored ribosome-binding protein
MQDSAALRDELRAMKDEVSRLVGAAGEHLFETSKSQASALAEEVRAALGELGDTLAQEETKVEQLIADRPVSSLASAFALGVVVGLMLRRH